MKEPLISIAVPTFNRPETTRAALQSALDQDFDDYEILVADNGPTDAIQKVVESLPPQKIRYWRTPPEVALAPKLNQFLERTRAPWMVILGDDDRFEPGYLSAMAGWVSRYPDAAVVHTRYRIVDERGRWIADGPPQPETMDRFRYLNTMLLPWYKRMVNICGVFFSVEKMRSAGGFMQSYKAWNTDTAAWAWLGMEGRAVFENRALVQICINPGSEYKKFDPNYAALLHGKRLFMDSMQRLFRRADALPASFWQKRHLASAKSRFMKYWMKEECHLNLEAFFLDYLGRDDASAKIDTDKLLQTIENEILPIKTPIYAWYAYLSGLPRGPRQFFWRVFSKVRHAYRIFFPPKPWHAMLPAELKRGMRGPWTWKQLGILFGIRKE